MKYIITCLCLMMTVSMMAQSNSNDSRKTNMSRLNGKAMTNTQVGVTDSPAANSMKTGSLGIDVKAVEGGVSIVDYSYQNSSARAAKLQPGDIITGINSKTIANAEDLANAMKAYDLGDVVTVKYMRGKRRLVKNVRIGSK